MTDLVAELEVLRGALLRTSRHRTMIRVVVTTALASITAAAVVADRLLATHNPTGPDREHPEAAAGIPTETPSQVEPLPPDQFAAAAAQPDTAVSSDDTDPLHPQPSPSVPTDLDVTAPTPKKPPPSHSPSVAEPMTESSIAESLKVYRGDFADCMPRYQLLRLAVARGRASLVDVNGMPFLPGIPEHTYLADGLRQLELPRMAGTAEFVVSLDLRARPESPR